jgi:hypothetical protein
MVVAMTVNAALVAIATAVTLLLPRRAAPSRQPAAPSREQVAVAADPA